MGNIPGTASDKQPGLTHAEKLFYLRNPSRAENSCCVGEAGGLIPPGLLAAVFGRSRLLKESFLPGIMHMPHALLPSVCTQHGACCLRGKQQSDFGLLLPVTSLSEQPSTPLKCDFGQKEFPSLVFPVL